MNTIQFSHSTTNEDNDMNNIHELSFSITELPYDVKYLGLTTTGTYMFYDGRAGVVYKWNPKSGYFRRNSHHVCSDGRNCLVTKNRIENLDLDTLLRYINKYRKTLETRRQKWVNRIRNSR